ncbi:uncharacterized protein LOC144411376 isoform X2 [Gasterosteus aculeatus]
MDYIKDIMCITSFTECTMEGHQVGQRDALVMVENPPGDSPADRRGGFKCAAASASVMGGVMVALGTAFMLHLFMSTPSCSQGSSPSDAQVKFNVTCTQRKMNPEQRYLVFTINRTAHYFIYGEIESNLEGELVLTQTHGDDSRTIQKRNHQDGKYVVLEKVQLHSGTSISIMVKKIMGADLIPDSIQRRPSDEDRCFFLFYAL